MAAAQSVVYATIYLKSATERGFSEKRWRQFAYGVRRLVTNSFQRSLL